MKKKNPVLMKIQKRTEGTNQMNLILWLDTSRLSLLIH